METERKKIPLGRVCVGEDISRFALFLANNKATWVTGSCFCLDGGKMRLI